MDAHGDWHPLGAILFRKWSPYSYSNYEQLDLINNNAKVQKSSILNPAVKLDDFMLCGSSFGGPIALVSTSHLTGGNKNLQQIFICTSSGRQLADFSVPIGKASGQGNLIIGVGWTNQEHLVVVTEDGTVFLISNKLQILSFYHLVPQLGSVSMFDIFGKLVTQFSLLDPQTSSIVSECQFWGDGVAALTSDMIIFVVEVLGQIFISERIFE